MKEYDYIISGAGAAGLSLLMRLMQNAAFDSKRILVVDKERKDKNDRTWCFWEQEPGLFEPVVHHRWQQVHFFSNHFSALLDLAPYQYKMIRSADLYQYVNEEAGKHSNVEFKYGHVDAVGNAGNKGLVIVDGERFTADYVFNSILFEKPEVPFDKYYLLQHFKGFLIQTTAPVFNSAQATLMDFRISQNEGTAFVYVLPLHPNKALVEFTMFSKQLVDQAEYDSSLRDYIHKYLTPEEFTVVEEEFGVIPMTNLKFVQRVQNVINIGTAGGQTKGSSGYTFQFIQKHSEKIVNELLRHGHISDRKPFFQSRFDLYDSTLLNVLSKNKMPGDKIFADMFSKNPVDRVLRFLDNETTFEDEINLMGTMPQGIFMKAALQEMFK